MRGLRFLPLLALALAGGAARAQVAVQGDDDRYEATVVGFQTTVDAQKCPRLYVTLRLRNRGEEPLRLAVDEAKIGATDEAGVRYVGGVQGALNNVVDVANVTRLVLPPRGTADALVWLYAPSPSAKAPGKTFRIVLPISNVSPDAKGRSVVGPTRLLRLLDLGVEEFAPKPGEEGSGPPTVVAGPFSAKVTDATVAPNANGPGEALVMTVAVTNLTSSPLPLALGVVTGLAIDEHGRTYGPGGLAGNHYFHQGIPDTSGWDVPPRFVLAPGATRSFTMSVFTATATFSMDERLGYYFRMVELAKGDDGKLHPGQEYSLSFLYVRPTGRATEPIEPPGDP